MPKNTEHYERLCSLLVKTSRKMSQLHSDILIRAKVNISTELASSKRPKRSQNMESNSIPACYLTSKMYSPRKNSILFQNVENGTTKIDLIPGALPEEGCTERCIP